MNKINMITNQLQHEIDLLKESKQPKFIFIGGIPGAGKSLLIKKAQIDFEDEEFSIIEPDLYRKYFKEAKSVEETVEQTNKIELNLLKYALKKQKNIIHISSLRAFEYIDKLINEIITPLGYDIYMYVIITNNIESALSTYERYIYDSKSKENFPRLNKYEYLVSTNESFRQAIEFFSKKGYFSDIGIFKRGNNMSLPMRLGNSSSNIIQIVEEEEKRQACDLDSYKINLRIKNIKEKLTLKMESDEFEKVVNEIIYKYIDKNFIDR